MAHTYFLKCLGIPELRSSEGEPIKFRVRKHLALLVYLAVEHRAQHERDRLVELLWPRSPWRRARHSLATALSILRKVFGSAAFTATRSHVRFTPADLELDLERLEAGDILGDAGRPPLDIDGFLRGFEIDAPDFDHWRDREHARRLPAIHVGLLTLIDHSRRRGATSDISAYGERILAIDSLAEEGIRARMEALALAGDRFSAIRVYEEWKDRLGEELGAVPSELLDGMVMRLRKRGFTTEPSIMPAVPAEQWRDRRFVGRLNEHRSLYEAWETTQQFKPKHMLVMGDSGVGKTTLAQRLVTAASLEGASVSRVQCFQMEQKLPFNAVGGLVVGLLGRPGIAATSPEALAEIGRIVPQIRTKFPNLPAPKDSEGESARILFAEGVMDLLGAVMNEHPLLLVIDDYHLADEASLSVLHLIMRRLPEPRMMIVLTARLVEEGETKQARRIREGRGYLGLVQLDLAPMPEDETRELLAVVLEDGDRKPSAPERRALVRASGGYPMVLELLVQDWRLNGPGSLALAFNAMKTEFRLSPSSADSYSRLASRIIPDLPETGRLVLDLASVLGSRLNDLTWYGLADLTMGQTMGAMSGLVAKRIFRDIGSGLEFINEIVRAEVYRGIPSPVRVALHGMVADRLLKEVDEGVWVPGLEMAWHLIRAKRTGPAIPHLMRGAREAINGGAPDVAVLALESGMGIVPQSQCGVAKVLLAQGYRESGRWQDVLALLEPIRDQLADANRREVDLFCIEARHEAGLLDPSEAILGFDELVRSLEADATSELAGRISFVAANLFDSVPSSQRGERLRTAVRRALHHQGVTTDVLSWAALAFLAHVQRNRTEEGTALGQAIELTVAANSADSLATRLTMGLASICIGKGMYDTALPHCEQGYRMAVRLDHPDLISRAASAAALSLIRLGNPKQAAAWASVASDSLPQLARDGTVVRVLAVKTLSSSFAGDTEAALLEIAREEPRLAASPIPWVRQMWLLLKADVLWLGHRRVSALRIAAAATSGDFELPLVAHLSGRFARWAALVSVKQETEEHTLTILQELADNGDEFDQWDRAEVAAAATLVATARSNETLAEYYRSKARLLMVDLPTAVYDQLRLLGMDV